MKKIALLLLALVLVFPVFAADNRVDFSMGYGGTFLYLTEVKSDPVEIQKLDFTLSGANYFLSDGDMGIAYAVDLSIPTFYGMYGVNTIKPGEERAKAMGVRFTKFNLGLSVMFDYNLDITEELSMDFAAGLGYDWMTLAVGSGEMKNSQNMHIISLDTQIAVNYAFAESFAVRGGLNASMPFVVLSDEMSENVENMKMIGFGISGFVGVSYLI